MKNKKKQFAAILLAASMLFINTNTSLYAKEEPKAKPEAAQETKTNRQPATTIYAPTQQPLLGTAPLKEETPKDTPVKEEPKTEPKERALYTDVKGQVYLDDNKNAKVDKEEKGLSDIEVRLYKIKEGKPEKEAAYHTLTNIKGEYVLEEVELGNYKIEYKSVDSEKNLKEYTIIQEKKDEKEPVNKKAEPKLVEKNKEYRIEQEDVELKEGSKLELALFRVEAFEEGKERRQKQEVNKEASKADNPVKQETRKQKETANKKTETNTTKKAEVKQSEKQEEKTIRHKITKIEPLMTTAQLNKLNSTKVGAANAQDSDFIKALYAVLDSEDWAFNAYYVGQNDKYHVEKTNDFSLKYQIEFHNNRDIEKGSVEIRIPATLSNDRDHKGILPTSIAIPQGTLDAPVENRITPFNYYLDEDTNELVFFNYKKITSGSNVAFQVLYKNLQIMEFVDDSTWSLKPTATVQFKDQKEEKTTPPLTGHIDSQVKLSKVTKTPYTLGAKSYYPGIYTEKQLASIVTSLPQEYKGDNFTKYKYVAWQVQVTGSATQPWELYLKDISNLEGKVVGFNRSYNKINYRGDSAYYKISDMNKDKLIHYDNQYGYILVVVAYPADKIQPNTLIENTVEVVLHPYDRVDEDLKLTSKANWVYRDYAWNYKGDIIGVDKSGGGTYKSFLEAYKAARKQNTDIGDIPFHVNSSTRGYKLTHHASNEDGKLGERIEGASYKMTTVDDFLYAYPNTGSTDSYKILDGDDYYYSQVSIKQNDTGYDPWEDSEAKPEESKDTIVYAMFKGSTVWEEVKVIPWNASGTMSYTFTEEQINRKPWRVKVEHESVNYLSTCSIDLKVRIQHDSPAFQELVKDEDNEQMLTLENIAGVMGQSLQDGKEEGYFHDATIGFNYAEPELKELSEALYGTLPMRDNAFAYLTSVQKNAASYKYGTSWNDAGTGRVHLKYDIMAYDGYELYGSEAIDYLKANLVRSPGRKDVVFYDLLPYGVKYDPSVEIIAGRVKTTNAMTWMYEKSWDTSQVKVSVDSKEDIITNYRGTGRMMVKFHIHYDGADPSGFYDSMWAESWGISFGAYYEWKDIDISNAATNISAFMPEKEDNEPLLGTDDQVMLDNGSDYPDTLSKDEYKVLGEDIDGDGITDERTVLYANTSVNDDMAIANSDTIEKLVKADNDRFGVFSESAIVAPKEGYTYEITVRNAQDTLKNIVVYDLLEDAPKHRSQQEKDKHFEDNWWYGTFDGIITTGLEKAGIKPVIYYNADRDARISTEEELPNSILTKENGWYTEEEWLKDHKFADVKAVAVDLSKKMNGDDFEIVDMGSVSFRIHMISPNEDESKVDADHSNTANKNDTAVYAYNNSAYYSEKVGTSTKHTVIGNSVQVSQHELEKVEIVKAFGGDVPKEKQNSEFRFIASYNGSTYATQEYQLFKKIDGTWERQGTNRVYATEADGSFYLHADEKAVFDVKDKNLLTVEEEENPFWKVEIETKEQDEIQIRTYKNTYRPVLYAQKKLENDPKDKEAEVKKESFIFQAFADGEPMANAEYWLVDSVRTDGGIPKKLNQNVLKTDKDGKFTIKAGEIVALFPGVAGTAYEIKETQKGDDWFTDAGKDSVTGTMVNDGNSVSITNYYKWKDLYLKKELTHQKAEDCTQAFTFQVFTKDTPFANAEWVILKEDGTESDVHGTTDDEGKFSIALAGKTVKIKGFEAGTSFKIVEIDNTSDNYEAIQGTVEGTMPLYALKSDATIINDYILRPIRVTKMVSYDATDMTEEKLNAINDKEFTMTIKVNGAIYANKEFTIQRSGEPDTTTTTTDIGTFTIKNGQTIIFHDVGPAGTNYEIIETPDVNYPQIFPANGESSTGTIDKEGSKVTFVNGTENTLLIGKEYVVGDGDVNKIGEQYLETIKNDPTIRGKEKVTLKLEVQDANGDWKIWPSETQNVQVTDALTNTIETITWNANSTLTLEPWKQVVIPTLTAGDSYRLSESTNDQYKLYKDGASFIEITQKEPLNDGAIQDTIENKPLAIIKNQIIGKQQKSIIQKKMRLGSEEIPTGSQLVFRVESYDGKVWNPANEISYIVGDDNDWINNRIQKTKADGKITVEKTAKGYPIIYFTEHDVKINPSNPMKDSYRIVEILEESEDTWGILSGYLQLADSYNGSLAIEDANTFVNSNRTTPIEIAKALNVDSEQEFTFELRQVTRSKQEVITSLEDILESREGTNISYVIYDVTTNKQIATGNTGTTGEIKIKGNQYAGLDLPDDTAWTVSEKQDTPYILTDLSGTNDKTLQLTKNMMLIQAKAPIILADLSVETNEEYFIEDSKVDKSKFTVNALYSDGRVVSLSDDDYEINIDTVPKNVRTFDLTFTYTDDQTGESIKKVKSLKTIGTITLTKEMVTTGVIDANTGEPVVLNTGEVEIPEVIMYEGNPRVITSIGELAFYGNENITSIKMPDTIISIERAAFEKCSKITGELRIPNSVTSIGKSAFQECKGFTGSLIIPDTVTSIGEYAFYGCKGFTGNLIIPDSVTSIENGAFSNCSGFNGTLTISKSITSIKSYVFSNCSNLSSSLIIPDKVTSIENYAFYDCNGLTGKLIIPKSVTSIGDDAFSYCSGFTGDLVIPDSVTSIGEYAFSNCNGFTGSLTIGNSITSIEDSTFYGCNGFKGDLIIPDSVTSIEEYAFYGCNGFKGSLIIPDTVTSIGYLSFYGCNGFTGSLIIPKSVTSIGSAAFQGCTNLEKIILQVIQIQVLCVITLGTLIQVKSNGNHHRKGHDIMKYIKRISVLLLAAFFMVAGTQAIQAEETTRMTFTNEENKTPDLFITKHVESADDRYEVPKDVAFKFVLKLNGKLANKEQYRVFNENGDEVYNHQDGTISSETTNKIPVMTDRNGNFTLYGGYTAKFEYVGNGVSYEILELTARKFSTGFSGSGDLCHRYDQTRWCQS